MTYFDDMKKNTVSPKNLIYVLHHPASKSLYVGKSSVGMKRPRAHLSLVNQPYYDHLPKTRWVKSLRKKGLRPEIVILEECDAVEDLDEAERFHIAYMRSLGMKLLNCTDGGGGIVGYHHSADSRAKISAVHKGKTVSVESRAKMSASQTGKKQSAKTRAKRSEVSKGRNKGIKLAPETCKKMSIAAIARDRSTPTTKAGYRKVGEKSAKSWNNPDSRAARLSAMKSASDVRFSDAEYRNTYVEICKATQNREDVKKKKSKAMKARWTDPNFLEKMAHKKLADPVKQSEGQKRSWSDPVIRARRLAGMAKAAKRRYSKTFHDGDST